MINVENITESDVPTAELNKLQLSVPGNDWGGWILT